jgi:serine/threonine protein kinase
MSQAEAPVRPGDVLAGKYRVEKILGVGGMGVVVAAFHLELEQRVALKFLLPAGAKRPDFIARFSREARALAKIRSEHVARVMDVGALEDGTPYIMMDYLEGRDLSEVLKQDGPVPVELAVDYVLQACVALAEAHAAGIVHRDLKPSNLFLARQPDGTELLKVLDFGIAKMPLKASEEAGEVGVMTTTTDMFGSPRYMSPEQLKSFRDVDARADLWALGVILYESVTGVSPFRRDTLGEIYWAVAFDEPPPSATRSRACPRRWRRSSPAAFGRILGKGTRTPPSSRMRCSPSDQARRRR